MKRFAVKLLIAALAYFGTVNYSFSQNTLIQTEIYDVQLKSDGCPDIVELDIIAKNRSDLDLKDPELENLFASIKTVMEFECPNAKDFAFNGVHFGENVFRLGISAQTGWAPRPINSTSNAGKSTNEFKTSWRPKPAPLPPLCSLAFLRRGFDRDEIRIPSLEPAYYEDVFRYNQRLVLLGYLAQTTNSNSHDHNTTLINSMIDHRQQTISYYEKYNNTENKEYLKALREKEHLQDLAKYGLILIPDTADDRLIYLDDFISSVKISLSKMPADEFGLESALNSARLFKKVTKCLQEADVKQLTRPKTLIDIFPQFLDRSRLLSALEGDGDVEKRLDALVAAETRKRFGSPNQHASLIKSLVRAPLPEVAQLDRKLRNILGGSYNESDLERAISSALNSKGLENQYFSHRRYFYNLTNDSNTPGGWHPVTENEKQLRNTILLEHKKIVKRAIALSPEVCTTTKNGFGVETSKICRPRITVGLGILKEENRRSNLNVKAVKQSCQADLQAGFCNCFAKNLKDQLNLKQVSLFIESPRAFASVWSELERQSDLTSSLNEHGSNLLSIFSGIQSGNYLQVGSALSDMETQRVYQTPVSALNLARTSRSCS